MSYTNDSSTIKTVLTQVGKQMLARGKFNPVTFAIGDTGVDYSMYTPSDPPASTDGAVV